MNRTIAADDLTAGDAFRTGAATTVHTVARVQDTRDAYTGPTLTITDTKGETVVVGASAFVTLVDAPAPALSLQAIAAAVSEERLLSADALYVENIGGGVYAVVDFAGLTITINGGQRTADGPAEVLVCRDGAEVVTAEVTTVAEVVELLHGHL